MPGTCSALSELFSIGDDPMRRAPLSPPLCTEEGRGSVRMAAAQSDSGSSGLCDSNTQGGWFKWEGTDGP